MVQHQRVRLSSVDTLTLFADESTTHRRAGAVPQLTCRGAGCKIYTPDVVQCYQKGGSGVDIQWKCEADLPASLKLGKVEVGCEGWDNSDDPYILKGSCGLTYHLKRVDASTFGGDDEGSPLAGTLFWLLFAAVAFWIFYPAIRALAVTFFPFLHGYLPGGTGPDAPGGGGGGNNRGTRPSGRGGYSGGGDAPPPYTPRGQSKPSVAPDGERGWRPGFWTGAATGAAATHLFGGRRQASEPSAYDFDRSPFAARNTGSSWFPRSGSNRAGLGRSDPSYRGQGSSRDVDGGGLGSIRSSTGYGGTSNR